MISNPLKPHPASRQTAGWLALSNCRVSDEGIWGYRYSLFMRSRGKHKRGLLCVSSDDLLGLEAGLRRNDMPWRWLEPIQRGQSGRRAEVAVQTHVKPGLGLRAADRARPSANAASRVIPSHLVSTAANHHEQPKLEHRKNELLALTLRHCIQITGRRKPRPAASVPDASPLHWPMLPSTGLQPI